MHNRIVSLIQKNLTHDLLGPAYKKIVGPDDHPYKGHCYVASEAYYHLWGKLNPPCKPMRMSHEGVSHWLLKSHAFFIDITGAQFKSLPDYTKAKGCGFLTKGPCYRSSILIGRVIDDMDIDDINTLTKLHYLRLHGAENNEAYKNDLPPVAATDYLHAPILVHGFVSNE
jgi:hypothetical protein